MVHDPLEMFDKIALYSRGIYNDKGELFATINFQLQINFLDKLILSSLNPDFKIIY